MSDHDIEALVERVVKNERRRGGGVTWWDRIMVMAIIAGAHAFIPSVDHSAMADLNTKIAVMEAHIETVVGQLADHEGRLRVIEAKPTKG
jgi:hypothetical protein